MIRQMMLVTLLAFSLSLTAQAPKLHVGNVTLQNNVEYPSLVDANNNGFIVKGMSSGALFLPSDVATGHVKQAWNNLSQLVSNIVANSVNTIRFQVCQPCLDPGQSSYDSNYMTDIHTAVSESEAAGLVVILNLYDDCSDTYCNDLSATYGMPTNVTENALNTLLTTPDSSGNTIAADQSVMIDLFNEPKAAYFDSCGNVIGGPTNTQWTIWLNGLANGGSFYAAHIPTSSCPTIANSQVTVSTPLIGMGQLVADARNDGSQNVLIVEGLGNSSGALYGIYDALGSNPFSSILPNESNYVLAMHPYFDGRIGDQNNWPTDFGNQSAAHVVLMDEWDARTTSGGPGSWCGYAFAGAGSATVYSNPPKTYLSTQDAMTGPASLYNQGISGARWATPVDLFNYISGSTAIGSSQLEYPMGLIAYGIDVPGALILDNTGKTAAQSKPYTAPMPSELNTYAGKVCPSSTITGSDDGGPGILVNEYFSGTGYSY